MPTRPMVSLGRMREEGMGLLILLEVGLGVVIDGGTGGVMGRRLSYYVGQTSGGQRNETRLNPVLTRMTANLIDDSQDHNSLRSVPHRPRISSRLSCSCTRPQ
jgi:hypothetical protein